MGRHRPRDIDADRHLWVPQILDDRPPRPERQTADWSTALQLPGLPHRAPSREATGWGDPALGNEPLAARRPEGGSQPASGDHPDADRSSAAGRGDPRPEAEAVASVNAGRAASVRRTALRYRLRHLTEFAVDPTF